MKHSYKCLILGQECEVCGYDDHGDLVLANGDRFRITPLCTDPDAFRSLTLRAVARLTSTGGEWLIDGVLLETYCSRQFASPRTEESDTKFFTALTLRDILAENRHEYLNHEYPFPPELQNQVNAVAWVEERFEDFPQQTRDPHEMPHKFDYHGEIINFVTAESPHAKAFQPIFLSGFYKIRKEGETKPNSPVSSLIDLKTESEGDVLKQPPGMTTLRRFRVALSFPGERREFIAQVAAALGHQLGKRKVFYDEFYEAELARPNLDLYLGDIYRNQADLLVPFFCGDYERKRWCKLEWRQMRDILQNTESDRIMPFRFDDALISGVLSIDGYIKVEARSPQEVAGLILDRLAPEKVSQTLIDPFSQLTRIDALVLNGACELLMEGTDPDVRVESAALLARLKSKGVSEEAFCDSIEVLASRDYIEAERVFGGGIPPFQVSVGTFGGYLRANVDRYEELVRQVAIEIVTNQTKKSDEIALKLGQPEIYIAHILNDMQAQDLVHQERLFQGPRVITNVSAELRRRVGRGRTVE